jgi:hypothetical protein
MICATVLLALSLPPQGGQPIYPDRLVQLDAVHAFGDPAANLCTEDGDWGFFSEGGRLVFYDFREIDVLDPGISVPDPNGVSTDFILNPINDRKNIQIGTLGIRPAEMITHPDLDLSDDGSSLAPDANDANDIVFIAGGRFGLWAMEAHPHKDYENKFVRIDNSGNPNSGRQNSERYCNGLEIVQVGSQRYLVALFAKARANRVRLYNLNDIGSVFLNADADGLGGELMPVRNIHLQNRTDAPPSALHNHPSGPANVLGAPFASDVDVEVCTATLTNLYVAMGVHGIIRVTLREASGAPIVSKKWGPMFGTDCPGGYDDLDLSIPGTANNTSGFPARRYRNFEWKRMERSQRFEEVTRTDPPAFVDIAVHNDGTDCKLYAAVDHLGWVQFDISDFTDWDPGMPIAHHEGYDVSLQPTSPYAVPELTDTAWFRRGAVGTIEQVTAWDPPLMRMFDIVSPPPKGKGAGRLSFCHELDLIHVEMPAEGDPGTVMKPVLVAQYSAQTWFAGARRPRTGGIAYSNDQNLFNGIESLALLKLETGKPKNRLGGRCSFHPIEDIDNATNGGLNQFTWSGWVFNGGEDTHFPSEQAAADTGAVGALHFVHGRSGLDTDRLDDFEEFYLNRMTKFKIGGCLAFHRLVGGPASASGEGLDKNAPIHIRNVGDRVGRHHFYLGPSVVDSKLMISSFSDSPFVAIDGMLRSCFNTTTEKWELEPVDMVFDNRAVAGVTAERTSQWIRNGDLWLWGSEFRVIPSSCSTLDVRVNHFVITENEYVPSIPTCNLRQKWSLSTPMDRWEHEEWQRRPEFLAGVTLAEYDSHIEDLAEPGDPESFIFTSSNFSVDGMQMFARDMALADITVTAPGTGFEFFDPRADTLTTQNRWSTVTFETHPEFGNFPAIPFHDWADQPAADNSQWTKAKNWWRAPCLTADDLNPVQASAVEARTYPPRLLKLRTSSAPDAPTKWVALVPCGHFCLGPDVVIESGPNPSPAVRKLFTPEIEPEFAPDPYFASKQGFGFLLIFDVDDPSGFAADSIVPYNSGGQQFFLTRSLESEFDPLVSSRSETAAYRVEVEELSVGGETRTYAFVAFFNGLIEVFDITDTLYRTSTGEVQPIYSWLAPDSAFDFSENNTRGIVVDKTGPDQAMVYVAVSRMGIVSVPFTPTAGFDNSQRHLVPTPGEVFGLELRHDPIAERRTLICADSYGGNRIYSLGSIVQQASGGTAAGN